MTRYKIIIEYDGTPFVGWQFQDNGISIQGVLETALFQLTQEEVRVEGAGRTDAGVHACGQVAHFDLTKAFSPLKIKEGLNFYLRFIAVVILACEITDQNFHARFSALQRSYRYIILNRKSPPSLQKNRVWWFPQPLDYHAMHQAAQCFIGQHDFTSFRATSCQSLNPVKTVDEFEVLQHEQDIWFNVKARSFLHHQVRNMVGTLTWIGIGKWQKEDLQKAFEMKSRSAAGPTAPAQGLYFLDVQYI